MKMLQISQLLCAFSSQSACFGGNNLELRVDPKVTSFGGGGKQTGYSLITCYVSENSPEIFSSPNSPLSSADSFYGAGLLS